jgi:hypothetical protein
MRKPQAPIPATTPVAIAMAIMNHRLRAATFGRPAGSAWSVDAVIFLAVRSRLPR